MSNSVQAIRNMTFEEYLKECIPLLNNEDLMNLITNYCMDYEENKKYGMIENVKRIDKLLIDIKDTLDKYKKKNNVDNIYSPNPNTSYVYKENKNSKFRIKSHPINGSNLIEGIVHAIVYKYSLNNNLDSIGSIDKMQVSNSGRLYEIMENVEMKNKNNSNPNIVNETLDNYIVKLYQSDILPESKNMILLEVLKIIANELEKLQNYCNFIHGDCHSANILIKYNKDNFNDINPIKIYFIDFGYSIVKYPLVNNIDINDKLLICTNVEENRDGLYIDLDKDENYYFKGIDMFHLINNLYSYRFSNAFINEMKPYLSGKVMFNNFIDNIISLYGPSYDKKKVSSKIHKNTRARTFKNFYIDVLIPSNFINIQYDGKTGNLIFEKPQQTETTFLNSSLSKHSRTPGTTPNTGKKQRSRLNTSTSFSSRLFGNNFHSIPVPQTTMKAPRRLNSSRNLFSNNNGNNSFRSVSVPHTVMKAPRGESLFSPINHVNSNDEYNMETSFSQMNVSKNNNNYNKRLNFGNNRSNDGNHNNRLNFGNNRSNDGNRNNGSLSGRLNFGNNRSNDGNKNIKSLSGRLNFNEN